jgi:hypothetical protein
MTTILFTDPKEVVESYINQATELFDKYYPKIHELSKLSDACKKKNQIKKAEEYNKSNWEQIKKYRCELKVILEQFGVKITQHNFSELYFGPMSYANHKVRNIETISPTKIKIFTNKPKKRKGACVFYLDLANNKWSITKYRYIDFEGKEVAYYW